MIERVKNDLNANKPRKNRAWLLAVLALLLVTAYHVHRIQSTYMRDDEEISFRTTQYDLHYVVWYQAEQDVQAPLWFPIFWGWQQVVGRSEFAGRMLGVFISMLTLSLTYQLGRLWFGGSRYGLFALALLGVNAYFATYVLEIRPYALVMLLAALSMLAFWRWLKKQNNHHAVLYGVTLALMMYAHYFLAFLILVQAIYFLTQRPSRTLLKQAGIAVVVALALWGLWLPSFINQVRTLREVETGAEHMRGIAGIGSTTEPTSLDAVEALAQFMTNGQVALYLLLLSGALLMLWRSRAKRTLYSRGYLLALLWALAAPAVALLANLVFSVYTQRYYAYASIGLALAVTATVAILPFRLLRVQSMVLAAFVTLNFWTLPEHTPRHVPLRDLFQQVSLAAQPGDVILFERANEDENFTEWQIRNYLSPDLQANLARTLDDTASARRIWYVTGDWFDPEVRATFEEIERTHPLQRVFGKCDPDWCYLLQLLEGPPLPGPIAFGDCANGACLPYWGVDVDAVTRAAIQARLWWRVEQPIEFDYSISLQLLTPDGTLLAQVDGPINHYNTEIFQTSQLEAGRFYVDFRALPLPADLVPGDYELGVVVYQWWDNARLPVADGDRLSAAMVTIPAE